MKPKLSTVAPTYEALPEAALVALARREDDDAVRELIRRCNQQLFRVARGILHNNPEAEDVVQAAYVSAFTKLENFHGEAAFATWLTRITMNEAFGRLRRKMPVVDLDDYRDGVDTTTAADPSHMITSPSTDPESEFGRTEMRAILEHFIDALPEPFRLTYVLRDVQEMPAKDVAQLLGINVLTVKTRLFRARRLLREKFNEGIAKEFSGVFPFDGPRCAHMADRVINALAKNAMK